MNHPYFEGWYFKHSKGGQVCSLIPGRAVNAEGEKSAFLQVISSNGSCFLKFPYREFRADAERCILRLGDCFFSRSGVRVSVNREDLRLTGSVAYSHPVPIRRSAFAPTLMGPFSYVPFMECSHDVLNLHHDLMGFLSVNGETMDFTGGDGYLEKDAGRSMPQTWLWYQCSDFQGPQGAFNPAYLMLAVAKIPFPGFSFPGLLCVCRVGETEHRLATYCGARLTFLEEREGTIRLEVRQGGYRLRLQVSPNASHELKAPLLGNMRRPIREYPACPSRVLLEKGNTVLLSGTGGSAGFERVGNIAALAK